MKYLNFFEIKGGPISENIIAGITWQANWTFKQRNTSEAVLLGSLSTSK